MEKQIQTVYVKTNRISNFLLCWHDGTSKFIRESMLNKQEAYLYTPEEHAAVQAALSKAEDKGGIQDCSLRINGKTMAETLSQQPTNSLDELEYYQAAREAFGLAVMNFDTEKQAICDSFILAIDRLLDTLNHNPCTYQ